MKTTAMALEDKMDHWYKNGRNVLLEGMQGVGKSSMVLDMVKRQGITSWKYYTASLMDPYLTLVGVPKEAKTESGDSYLNFIRPREFMDESIEFIFLDEFNRAGPVIRNSVMELIQFGSINGVRLPNLKCVWGAINPYDDNETFNVQELDPAQKDRFHVYYKLPFEPSYEFFKTKFNSHMADAAISYWNKIPEDIRTDVSPRRLEYALEEYQIGGDLNDILPELARPEVLLRGLENFNISDQSAQSRWLSDPEDFIEEITCENKPTDVDVVAAFTDLKTIQIDMATDYVGRLLPEQLGNMFNPHIDLLLRNHCGPKSEAVECILAERTWHEQDVQYVLDMIEERASSKFVAAYKQEDFDEMCEVTSSGYEYTALACMVLRNDKLEFPYEQARTYCKNNPEVLAYLAMCSVDIASKIMQMS